MGSKEFDTTSKPVVQIRVVGAFRLIRSDGEECTPPNRKSRALLALLALSPGNQRTRLWMQERLWGTRGREQGAASIRQCLADIRKVLGQDRDCLRADRTTVSLDRRRVQIDLEETANAPADEMEDVELLEGLDIPYEDFSDWLKEQRQLFRKRSAKASGVSSLNGVALCSDVLKAEGNLLVLSRCGVWAEEAAVEQADDLLDHVGRTITELGVARVIDRRKPQASNEPDVEQDAGFRSLSLSAQSFETAGASGFRISLVAGPENEFLLSRRYQAAGSSPDCSFDLRLVRQSNDVVGMTIDRLANAECGQHAPSRAAALCYEGVRTLFKLGEANFRAADELFAAAYDLNARGLFLAWRAYVRTFLLVELRGFHRPMLEEEAFGFLRKALEAEPNNSYVNALGAHVHAILRRSYISAYELAERSIDLNPANPIGWACLGIAQCYLGKSGDGLQSTLRARSIAGFSPVRYQIDTLGCIAATMARDFETAVHLGESSHLLAPDFAAPMRYLAALYIVRGEEGKAFSMVDRLRSKEPDFSFRKLAEQSYPSAGLHRANVLSLLPAD
jgi:tetratricopeptide (TPR) repeat protein